MTRRSDAGRRRPYRTTIVLAGMFVLAFLGVSRAGPALVVSHPVEPPDAIVALASHEWERLPAVVDLAGRYPASTVLLTVPLVITESNCHQCAERVRWLIDQGLEGGRIQTLPDRVSSTQDEAAAVRRYAEQHGIRRLAIVTSPYHARRALATFRAALEELPVEIGMYPACGTSPARPARWWARGYDRAYVTYEWAAALYYRFKYGIPLAVSGVRQCVRA